MYIIPIAAMWKRILLFVLAGIAVLIGGAIAFHYVLGPAQAPASAAKVALTPERIARGKYPFENVADCGDFHSERDFTRVGGPMVPGRQGSGTVLSSFFIGLPGLLVAPNITPDVETGLGTWTDGEKIRAIRDGVDKDGNALVPGMPYPSYRSRNRREACRRRIEPIR
jgi:hypothetical protein